MRIAVLGTGGVGRTLADGLASAGHAISLGTHDPDATRERGPGRDGVTVRDWLAAHPDVELLDLHEAAAGADLVINATPGAGSLGVLAAIGEDALEGKVLWDVANPLDFSHGAPPSLDPGNTDSLAETIQRTYPDTHVVKSLNTVNTSVMTDPAALGDEHVLFVSGDGAEAKATVVGLLQELGWHPDQVLDLGGIETARATEGYLPLWLALAQHLGTLRFNLSLVVADEA